MKVLEANKQTSNLVMTIEKAVQQAQYSVDKLLLVCTEENKKEYEKIPDISSETMNIKDLKSGKTDALKKYNLEEYDQKKFNEAMINNGYVLLVKEANQSNKSGEKHTKNVENTSKNPNSLSSEGIKAPGFGVNLNKPKSDADTHEDVFNPDDPDPDNVRK
ncbi:MAG: hypothetical protein L0I88_06705 [Alkalibacterium sp.]|uniref:hypothetical protein n=1 Tax=Alkalibacterium gilvum TaxID=1130080 RepID=UPI002651877A|nr:hypothetical protein [Alkalibacterium sp.]MDN6731392.1 hypothetical protein [Atopostipes suicloacalis]